MTDLNLPKAVSEAETLLSSWMKKNRCQRFGHLQLNDFIWKSVERQYAEAQQKAQESENKYLKAFREGKRVYYKPKCSQGDWTAFINHQAQPDCGYPIGYEWKILTTRKVPLEVKDYKVGELIEGDFGPAVVWDTTEDFIVTVRLGEKRIDHTNPAYTINWKRCVEGKFVPCTKTEEVEE